MLRIGVDIGGTFTDLVAWRGGVDGEAEIVTLKVPSTPPDFARGFRDGFEQLLQAIGIRDGEPVYVMHGTTVSTNTVIERSGAPVSLLVTAGFRDLLDLQRLRMLNPMDVFGGRAMPLVDRQHVHEIRGRLDGKGRELEALSHADILAALESESGVKEIAVSFLHSYRDDGHERQALRQIAAARPDVAVTLSSEIWPRIGEYERAMLSVLNAYVRPRMDAYLSEVESYVEERLPGAILFITRSNGGVMSAALARRLPVHTLLSGPSSGVNAAQFLGAQFGSGVFLTMDMGGTSTDVALIRDGQASITSDAEVGDFPLIMPVTGIEAIGAGGGSIVRIDEGTLRVGPQSAGAWPGPACFGRGGLRPALTDAYLLSGYLDPDRFLGGRMKLDVEASRRAMETVAAPLGMSVEAAAQAAIQIATSNMIARVMPYLARHGVDTEDLSLIVFGGAGSIHGPLLAEEVGIRRVVAPTVPAVFCAFGGIVSDLIHDTARTTHGMPADTLETSFRELEKEAVDWLASQVSAELLSSTGFEHWAEIRYKGQSFEVDTRLPAGSIGAGLEATARAAFNAEYLRLYGHNDPEAPIEIIAIRVRIRGKLAFPVTSLEDRTAKAAPQAVGRRRIWGRERWLDAVPVYDRRDLSPAHPIAGPAIIEQGDTTMLVVAGSQARIQPTGEIVVTMEP